MVFCCCCCCHISFFIFIYLYLFHFNSNHFWYRYLYWIHSFIFFRYLDFFFLFILNRTFRIDRFTHWSRFTFSFFLHFSFQFNSPNQWIWNEDRQNDKISFRLFKRRGAKFRFDSNSQTKKKKHVVIDGQLNIYGWIFIKCLATFFSFFFLYSISHFMPNEMKCANLFEFEFIVWPTINNNNKRFIDCIVWDHALTIQFCWCWI